MGEVSERLSDECDGDSNATRILIVEDTPEVARWQMRQLNPLYNFYFAADGAEGLEKAKEIVPDLIITDIMMPVMDGYQLCRSIRESEMLCHPFPAGGEENLQHDARQNRTWSPAPAWPPLTCRRCWRQTLARM